MAGEEFLKTISKAREEVKTIADSPLAAVVMEFAEEALADMKANTPKASGALQASLAFSFKFEDQVMIIEFTGDDYWDYVNSGVDGVDASAGAIENKFGTVYSFKSRNPSRKMVDSFMGQGKQNWLASKGITSITYGGQTHALQTDKDYRAAAYVFARAVKKHGIKPSNFVGRALSEDRMRAFEEEVLTAFENII